MPIRIKPDYNLGYSVLNLKAIKEISSILQNSFPEAKFSANYDYREIYDEPRESFLEYISELENLDSFSAKASGDIGGSLLSIKLIFDDENAAVSFVAQPEHEKWIEHFMIDLKEQCLKPTFFLKLGAWFQSDSLFQIKPYSKIILKQNPPNPLIENIKGNILSSIIWLIAGMFVLYIMQHIVNQ